MPASNTTTPAPIAPRIVVISSPANQDHFSTRAGAKHPRTTRASSTVPRDTAARGARAPLRFRRGASSGADLPRRFMEQLRATETLGAVTEPASRTPSVSAISSAARDAREDHRARRCAFVQSARKLRAVSAQRAGENRGCNRRGQGHRGVFRSDGDGSRRAATRGPGTRRGSVGMIRQRQRERH